VTPALSLTVNEQDETECLDSDERVLCVQFLLELNSVAIVCESGTLCTVDLSSMSIEVVGAVSDGCASASWSPDQELLALTTQTGQLLLMSTNWNTLSEVSLPQSLKGAVVSWRGDGQYFVVAGTNTTSYLQLVYSRQGEFQTMSDPLPLYHNTAVMTWRPAGNLIATVQQSGNKQQVLFYERNGLRFSEFTLPASAFMDPAAKCVQIEYSCDSELLGVLMVHESQSYMLLLTHNNGHHYLKWSSCQQNVCSFKFDPEHGTRVVLCTSSGIIRCLNFTSEDCISTCRSRTAGVVDFISNDQKSCLGHAHQGVQVISFIAILVVSNSLTKNVTYLYRHVDILSLVRCFE
jgi:elongator complex protein 1